MDIEGIKEIAAVIQSLGEGGKEAFIWWMVAKYGFGILQVAMFLSTVLLVGFGIGKPLVIRGMKVNTECRKCYRNSHADCTPKETP